MHSICKTLLELGAALTLLSACAWAEPTKPSVLPTPSPTHSGILTPYLTATASATAAPVIQITPSPLPSPTPTPLTHTVKKGEDMGGIAFQYGISVEALLKANPQVNPRAMSVGTTLIIPGSAGSRATTTVLAPTPTPIALAVGELACYPTQEGGLWCFIPVHNNQEKAVENLTAQVRLGGLPDGKILEGSAYSALNLLPAGASLPLTAYFPPPVPESFQASAELASALPVENPQAGGRYIPAHIDNQEIYIDPSGLSAQVTGDALLDVPDTSAAAVWIAATAYDAQNHIVGVRRWENPQPLASGKRLPVDFSVYSLAGAIQRVETLIEARPGL